MSVTVDPVASAARDLIKRMRSGPPLRPHPRTVAEMAEEYGSDVAAKAAVLADALEIEAQEPQRKRPPTR